MPVTFPTPIMIENLISRYDFSRKRNLFLREKAERFERIFSSILLEFNRMEYLPPYTIHDARHCIAVEYALYGIVKEQNFNKFTSTEAFLLLLAIWFHDFGMNPVLFKQEDIDIKNTFEDDFVFYRKIRDEHADRSSRFIQEEYTRFDLEPFEATLLMKIIEYHRFDKIIDLLDLPWFSEFRDLNGNMIRQQLLIAYLRLSDALDIPQTDKTPTELKILLSYGIDPITQFHWFKSIYAQDPIKCSDTDFTITIPIKIPDTKKENLAHDSEEKEPEDWIDNLKSLTESLERLVQNELDSIKNMLAKGGINYYAEVKCEYVPYGLLTKEDINNLKELITNIEIFDFNLTPNSSLLKKKILNQISFFLKEPDPQVAIKFINRYISSVIGDYLNKQRFHIVVKVIQKEITTILSTRNSPEEKSKKIRDFVQKLENSSGDNVKIISAELLQELIHLVANKHRNPSNESDKPTLSIFLYAYSGTIINCLPMCIPQIDAQFQFYIGEARPKTSYRYNNRLLFSDGINYALKISELMNKATSNKYSITIVPDIAISHLFSDTKKTPDVILFGANGIGVRTNNVTHSLGHLTVADIARKYRIPVFVCAESIKRDPSIDTLDRRDEIRNNNWLTTDIAYLKKIRKIEKYNPRGDLVQGELITRIITEDKTPNPGELSQIS